MSSSSNSPSDIARYRSALFHLKPDIPRDQWFKAACGFKDAGGTLPDFDDWSKDGETYSQVDTQNMWKSIKPGKTTKASLLQMAFDAGWKDEGAQNKPTAAEMARRSAEQFARRAEIMEAEAKRHAEAAARAKSEWAEATPAEVHPYLCRKGVKAYGLRIGRWRKFDPRSGEMRVMSEEALLVPIRDASKQLHSLQAIFPTDQNVLGRDRDYLPGGVKKGHFHTIGKPRIVNSQKVVVICTGYATGASVHEATGHAVVVAFDDSNLLHVAEVFRRLYPDADLIIFSDRDAEALHESGGTKAALKAALRTRARVVVPEWMGVKGRDANDIHLAGFPWKLSVTPGADVLRNCVMFATPFGSAAFKAMLHECGVEPDDLEPPQAEMTEGVSKIAAAAPPNFLGDEEGGFEFLTAPAASLAKPTQPPFSFTRVGDMQLKPIDWLIKGHLEADSLALLFSDPGVGKSFMAIDMAYCVATGRPWHGNATTRGAVFYIAGEGHNGLTRRFKAWEIENGVSPEGVPFYISKKAAAFCQEDSTKSVIEAVRNLAKEAGEQPRLIVVDTVARNFGLGDENSTAEMGEFIRNLDELKHEFKATVLLVHHSGHGDKGRARGSMALKGALDAEYRLERDDDGVIRFETTKMKEVEYPAPLSFRLGSVTLPLVDQDGKEETSAVMRPVMHVPKAQPGKAGGGKHQVKGLAVLKDLETEHRARVEESGRDGREARVKESDWRERLEKESDGVIDRRRFPEVKKGLLAASLITIESGGYVQTT